MKNLLYIYKKSKKRIQLIYFLKYKKQIALLKSKQYKNKSFVSTSNHSNYNNYNACYRLYNGLKIKQDNIDKLSQRFLQDEAEKYPYFPEINKYDLIYKNYYLINNIPIFENKSQNKNKYILKTEIPNLNNKNIHYKNAHYDKIDDEEGNNHYLTYNDNYNNIYDENINLNNINNNNYINKNNGNYDSIIKKKIPLLEELDKEEKKIKNTTRSKIMDYKNTIPNNYKKNFKKNSGKSTKINKNIPKKFYEKKSEENYTNYNLTGYYPSPITKKDLNNNSNHNLLLNDENSNYTQSSFINNNNNIVLSPNDNINNRYNHYSSKSGLPLEIVRDYNNKDKKKSNSYKFLPNNKCSMSIEAKKNKTNLNSKRNNIYNKIDIKIGKNKISYASNNRVLNSIGFIDNSLSTNFIDRQSINDNHTISANDNNQPSVVVYNKNKNISYTFPTKYNKENKESNINLSGENYNNKIYFKKINNHKRAGKKNHKKVFDRIIIENKRDNITSNTIKTDSSSKNPKIKNKVSFKEKSDFLIITNDLLDEKKISELKIASGEVNENVNIKKNKQDKMLSTSQKSEPNTIQSLSDSKILEIANYYLNEEETVDKIEIGDILFTKNNKSNINNKKK